MWRAFVKGTNSVNKMYFLVPVRSSKCWNTYLFRHRQVKYLTYLPLCPDGGNGVTRRLPSVSRGNADFYLPATPARIDMPFIRPADCASTHFQWLLPLFDQKSLLLLYVLAGDFNAREPNDQDRVPCSTMLPTAVSLLLPGFVP